MSLLAKSQTFQAFLIKMLQQMCTKKMETERESAAGKNAETTE